MPLMPMPPMPTKCTRRVLSEHSFTPRLHAGLGNFVPQVNPAAGSRSLTKITSSLYDFPKNSPSGVFVAFVTP